MKNTIIKIKYYLIVLITIVSIINISDVDAAVSKPTQKGGLVGRWTFDSTDISGTKAYDKSGQGNDGTLISSILQVGGKIGQALKFNGVDSYVSVGNVGIDNTNVPMTLSAWVYRTIGTREYILSNGEQSTGQAHIGFLMNIQRGCGADVTAAGAFQLQLDKKNTSSATYHSASGLVPLNTWTYVAVTYNGNIGSGNAQLYLNGQPVTTTYTANCGTVNPTAYDDWFIGRYSTIYSSDFIDDVRIYNRALSSAEIASLYKETEAKIKPVQKGGLVGSWTFDSTDISGTKAYDKSGYGNNGTLINGPTQVNGKRSQALNFNGSNSQYMTVPSITLLSTNQTVSAWVNMTSLSSGMNQYVFDEGGNNHQIQIYDGDNNNGLPKLACNSQLGGTEVMLSANTWYHITCIMRSDGTISAYINGRLNWSGSGSTPAPSSITVGRYSGGGYHFNGTIDDIRVYNRALSDTEVLQLYQSSGGTQNVSPTKGLSSGLVGNWTFDGKYLTTATATDSVAGNNATRNGTAIATGKLGQALKFDGSSYLSMSSTAIVNDTGPVTVSLWVKPTSITDYQSLYKFKATSEMTFNIGSVGNSNLAGHSILMCFRGNSYIYSDDSRFFINNLINKWHSVVVIYNGGAKGSASSWAVYLDGVSVSLASSSSCGGSTNVNEIGRDNSGGGYLVGMEDDIRVYNRALSATEVQQLYNLGGR